MCEAGSSDPASLASRPLGETGSCRLPLLGRQAQLEQAAARARLAEPIAEGQLEAGPLERPLVDGGRDPAQSVDLLGREAQRAPRVDERALQPWHISPIGAYSAI